MIVIPALILLFCYIIIFSLIDLKRERTFCKYPAISFVIPCYNDADTIPKTIRSIYHVYRDHEFELIVINDASEDCTLEVLEDSKQRYPFQLVNNTVNLGKARALNDCIMAVL